MQSEPLLADRVSERTTKENRRRGSDARRNGRAQLPRYDQALLAAKNANVRVCFHLAQEMGFTDEMGLLEGQVLEVDKYQVKIAPNEHPDPIWINKLHIVATVILK